MPLKLFAVPHAGGGPAAFRDWSGALPDGIELVPLCLPGRGARSTASALREWPALLEVLLADVQRHLPGRCAFFGHSLGGLVAFELAHALRERTGHEPICLGVSACTPPRARVRRAAWLEVEDDVVLEYLRALGGTPPEILEAPELLRYLLPTIRADLHLADSYRREERAPLGLRLLALGGTDDPSIGPCESLRAWSVETRGPFRYEAIEGGHFFIQSARRRVLELLLEELRAAHLIH